MTLHDWLLDLALRAPMLTIFLVLFGGGFVSGWLAKMQFDDLRRRR